MAGLTMTPRYGFLIEFLVITIGIAAAHYLPLYGVPYCLLSMAVLRFFMTARQDNPKSVSVFIVLSIAAMILLLFGIPERWLTAPQFTVDRAGIISVKGTWPLTLWKTLLLVTWCALFYSLLRRYRFTQATAREASDS